MTLAEIDRRLQELSRPVCRFCGRPAVALYRLTEGCAVYSSDREQDLCVQHAVSAEPIGEMILIAVHDAEAWEWFLDARGRR
jgi:hypothetical protein